MTLIHTLAVGLGASWVAGINLYATVAVLGILGRWGGLQLPGELAVLTNGWVIAVATALYTIEFFIDKIPWLDSAWDLLHTFIRVPAGAVIAASAFGDYNPAIQVITLLLGGSLALSSHTAKSATRAIINLSPEPVSNVVASVSEDAVTVGYLSLVYFLPVVALSILIAGMVVIAMVLPRFVRLVKGLTLRVRRSPTTGLEDSNSPVRSRARTQLRLCRSNPEVLKLSSSKYS